MQDYIEVRITSGDAQQRDILIAQLILLGFDGVEETSTGLIAAIRKEEFNEAALAGRIGLPFSVHLIRERNWNEEWERSFEPVVIDNFCLIRATFHNTTAHTEHEIIITPKMSFGTGHHATTYQMIQHMRKQEFAGKSVLDFGSGTGVLSILAEKLSAASVTGIDYDPWSIANAMENIEENGCKCITILQADSLNVEKQFDIILANINKHVILAQLHSIKQHLRKDGVVIFSGLLQQDEEEILQSCRRESLTAVEVTCKDKWIALTLKSTD